MKYYAPPSDPSFTGRKRYWRRLEEIDAQDEAAVIVIYGRRRVGKTALIEQFFLNRPILKFEGLQPDRENIRKDDAAEKERQITECLARLGRYVERPGEYSHMRIERWSDFFALLVPLLQNTPVILYLEELQWMANYGDELLSEFKPYWDDVLRHNRRLRVVISGSSPSFIVNQFLASSAMYNRSNHMMKLEPFTLSETHRFLGTGHRESVLAAIAVGGIPEYLKQLKSASSVYVGLCEKSFRPDSFFRVEKKKVFVSSLSSNRFYEGTIDYLAQRKSAQRTELYKTLTKGETGTPGGSFSNVLQELVELDFIERTIPITAALHREPSSKRAGQSRLARYVVADEYLQFYYKFIEPHAADIDKGKYDEYPTRTININDFSKLMGFSFERWCRRNEYLIAKAMGFANVVEYDHGPWYEKDAVQVDLMYIRKDSKVIICEIKYNNDSTLTRQVIREMQQKVDIFLEHNPKYARHTIETALITTEPAPKNILGEGYFTYVLTSEDLLSTAQKMER